MEKWRPIIGCPDDIEMFMDKETYEQHENYKVTAEDLVKHYFGTLNDKTILKFGCGGVILTKDDIKEIKERR